jgi:hypothetical protein
VRRNAATPADQLEQQLEPSRSKLDVVLEPGSAVVVELQLVRTKRVEFVELGVAFFQQLQPGQPVVAELIVRAQQRIELVVTKRAERVVAVEPEQQLAVEREFVELAKRQLAEFEQRTEPEQQ